MQDNPYHGYGADQGGSLGSLAADVMFSPWTLIPWGMGMSSGRGWTAGKLGSNVHELGYSGRERRNWARTVDRIKSNRDSLYETHLKNPGKNNPGTYTRDKFEDMLDNRKFSTGFYNQFGGKKKFNRDHGIGLNKKGSMRAHNIGKLMKRGGYALMGAAIIDGIFDYAKEAASEARIPNGYNMSHAAVHNREAINQRQQAMQLVREMPGWVQRQGSESRRFHT